MEMLQSDLANLRQFPQIQSPYPQPIVQQAMPQYHHAQPGIPSTSQYQPPQPQARPSSSSVDLQKLHADIDDLTTDAKIECATHPMDKVAQGKLTTLQSLKEIIDSGAASENDLQDIRNSIMQEMAKKMAAQRAPAAAPIPQSVAHHAPSEHLRPYAPPPPSYGQPSLPPASSAAPSFLNTTNLADLLRATATPAQQSAYPPNYPPQPIYATGTPTVMHSTPAPVENPLLAQLRASGLFAGTPPPQVLPPTLPNASPGTYQGGASLEVILTSASVRIHRPHLVTNFLSARPNQCSTCGRRFTSDDVGKEKKARHLDWHFKTKARMIEAERRGQNRSWYVDERDWIASREYEDDAVPVDGNGDTSNGLSSLAVEKKKQKDFVRVPSDPNLRNAPCPIDQEPFKSEWSEEVQDFIWKDAIQVAGRYYHASCYREVTKVREKDVGGNTPLGAGTARTSTPDSVLGKRKAEEEVDGPKSKVKLEVV